MCELIDLHLKKKEKKRRRGMNCRTFSKNPRTRGKSHHHNTTTKYRARRKTWPTQDVGPVGRAQLTYKLGGVDGDGLLCVASLSLLEARRHHVVWNQVPAQQPLRHVVVVVRLLRHRVVSGEVLAGTEIPEGDGGGGTMPSATLSPPE